MKIPENFANSRTWYLIELSQFEHPDVHFPHDNEAVIRLFYDYDMAIERIEELKEKYGQFYINIFSYEPPYFDYDPTIDELEQEEKRAWKYLTDDGWVRITHMDMIGSLTDRLWAIMNSEMFDINERPEFKN